MSLKHCHMLSFVLGGPLPEGLILQSNIISVLLLPNFSICYSFLKNVVISDGECVVLEVADPRSLFYSGKTAGRMSFKIHSASQGSNPDPCFFFLFLLPNHLSQKGRLFHSIPCFIPHELCLFHVYITLNFCLPLSASEFIQLRVCNSFTWIKYVIHEWLGLVFMCFPSSLGSWRVSIRWCPFCLISCFDLVFSLSLKAEWVSTWGLCNSLIIETIDHKGSLRAITSIEPTSRLCICTKSK